MNRRACREDASPRDPLLYSFPESAKILGISARTLRAWAAAGKIAVVRLSPRVIRIQSEELLRLVAESRVEVERRPGDRS